MDRDEHRAFDVWLMQGLANQYRPVLGEPLPDKFLRILNRSMPEH